MNPKCDGCELDFEREPGFYLGSIYVNYGLTVALVGPTFAVLTLGLGYPRTTVAIPCAVFTILFPLWFFRYARSIWLCLGWVATSADSKNNARSSDGTTSSNDAQGTNLDDQHADFQSDDAMAALVIGGALIAIFLVMIVLMVSVGLWTANRAPL